ncbi:MAG: MTH938/NDUFAF3 family protein [Thermodesulfobacteriota bacterium]
MIEKYSFGRMVIDGTLYSSDLTIINGTVHPDWWRKNGHRVCVEDVAGILADTPQILVIGRGRPGLMKSEKELVPA